MPRMPFSRVPCQIWLAHEGEPDAYNNRNVYYTDEPDHVTECCYYQEQTADGIEDGRPHADEARLRVFLPKTLVADLRGARLKVVAPDDAAISGHVFSVVGSPESTMRANTPGDMSWDVRAVRFDG